LKFERYGKGIAKGLTVTMKNLLRQRVTTQYPERRLTVSRRTRGNELVWNKEKCTGCGTCSKTCPQGVINVVTHKGEENDYVVDQFEVDTGYCISCGLCVESCPYEALFMGYAFEKATYRRNDLVQSNEMLLASAERKPSSYFHPEIDEGLPEQTLLVEGKISEKQ